VTHLAISGISFSAAELELAVATRHGVSGRATYRAKPVRSLVGGNGHVIVFSNLRIISFTSDRWWAS